MKTNLSQLTVNLDATVRDVIECMDRGRIGAVIVASEGSQFEDILTDGDIRRGILQGVKLTESVAVLRRATKNEGSGGPITVTADTGRERMLEIMLQRVIRHLPVLAPDGRIVELLHLPELIESKTFGYDILILAGGQGSRLRPLTESTPKPMLPVGDRPIIEILVRKLHAAGFRRFYIATHYLAGQIQSHLARLQLEGAVIEYLHEEQPLGTGGALRLIPDRTRPKLVVNADIMTEIDFGSLRSFHEEQKRLVTLCLRSYHVDIPYGVVETNDGLVTRLREKPNLHFFVNAGIYIVDPRALELLPPGERFDMTDLVQSLLERGLPVASFPIYEYWLDIGQPRDYQRAQEDARDGKTQP